MRRKSSRRYQFEVLESRRMLFGGWFGDRYQELENGARDLGGEISGAWHGIINSTTRAAMRANLNKYVSDWSYTEFHPSSVCAGGDPVYYVNGMDTSRSLAESEAQTLSNHIRRDVRLIYNGTVSPEVDLGEAFKDKFWFPPIWQHNATTREVAGLFYNAALNGREISIVAHSQGTIIANNAMKTVAALGYESWMDSKLALVMTGAPLWNFEVAQPAKFKRYDNPGDGISNWLGERLDNWYGKFPVSEGMSKHRFRANYVHRITQDNLFGAVCAPTLDRYEANNTSSTATNLGTATPTHAVFVRNDPLNLHSSSDEDWFRFTISGGPAGKRDAIGVAFNHSETDIDIALYRQNSNGSLSFVGESESSNDEEELLLEGLATGTYFLKVFSYDNQEGTYELSYEISPDGYTPDSEEPDNSRSSANFLDSIVAGLGGGGSTTGLNIHQPGDVDWYYVDADTWPAAGTNVRINFTHSNGDLDMELYRIDNGTLLRIAESDGSGNSERLNLDYLPPGRYYIKIFGYEDAINTYGLSYDFPGGGLPADGGEPGDNTRTSAPLLDTFSAGSEVFYDPNNFPELLGLGVESGVITSLRTIHNSSDEDWRKLTLRDWGRRGDAFYINRFLNSEGDLDLELYNSFGEVVRRSTSTKDFEVIRLDDLAPGDYFVRVYGHNSSLNWYAMSAWFVGMQQDSYETIGGNSLATARMLGTATLEKPLSGFLDSDPTIHSSTDADWYRIDLDARAASGAHVAIDFFTDSESGSNADSGDLELELYDAQGTLLDASTTFSKTELLNLANRAPGSYYVKVYGYLGSTNQYGIRYNVPTQNDPPGIILEDSANYVENNLAKIISPQALVGDLNSRNFADGYLLVQVTGNRHSNDILSLRKNGAGTERIVTTANGNVTFGGKVIGSVRGGENGAALIVRFNTQATRSAVRATVRSVAFETTGDNPSTQTRTVRLALNDGDGGQGVDTMKVNVIARNDRPVISGILTSPVGYRLNAPAAALLAGTAVVSDVDSANFSGGKLTVRITAGSDVGNRLELGGTLFTINANNNRLLRNGVVIGTLNANAGRGFTKFEVTFNSNALASYVQQLVRAVRFRTLGSSLLDDRTVSFSLSDGDGGTSISHTRIVDVR